MHFVDAKGILSSKNGMNIYRGCTHGCIYCDSRSVVYQMKHDFEDVGVKQNAPELLEKALRSKRNKCMVGTGSMCDPYMHCEERLGLTGKCLEIIEKHGAVSEETARLMAEGVRKLAGTTLGLSSTGIAGPTGASPGKPVGTVWFAWAVSTQAVTTRCAHFPGDREAVRASAVEMALSGLCEMLRGTPAPHGWA